jgi:two-component system chemotaxis response regulator CheB
VVVSSVSEAVLDAMNAGAVDFVAKPDLNLGRTRAVFLAELIEKIKIAAKSNLLSRREVPAAVRNPVPAGPASKRKLIAIGASTGGTEAIFSVLCALSPETPGIVVVQHIPPVFSRMFAERLNKTTPLRVREAQPGDYVEPGLALIAPGDRHMRIKKVGDRFRAELAEGEKTDRHCPSVDVLFESLASACGSAAVGVILTGMGDDGARGLLAMRRSGARTIGQDEKSCVVYGMPRAAWELGAVEKQASLEGIPQAIALAVSR